MGRSASNGPRRHPLTDAAKGSESPGMTDKKSPARCGAVSPGRKLRQRSDKHDTSNHSSGGCKFITHGRRFDTVKTKSNAQKRDRDRSIILEMKKPGGSAGQAPLTVDSCQNRHSYAAGRADQGVVAGRERQAAPDRQLQIRGVVCGQIFGSCQRDDLAPCAHSRLIVGRNR